MLILEQYRQEVILLHDFRVFSLYQLPSPFTDLFDSGSQEKSIPHHVSFARGYEHFCELREEENMWICQSVEQQLESFTKTEGHTFP